MTAEQSPPGPRSSEEKLLAGVAHLGVLFQMVGLFVPLVILLLQRQTSRFVADHARQALGYQLVVVLVQVVLSFFLFGFFLGGFRMPMPGFTLLQFPGPARVAFFIFSAFLLAASIYGVVAAVAAFSGREFRYAFIGDLVARL